MKWGQHKKDIFAWDFGKCLIQLKEEIYSSKTVFSYKMQAPSKYTFTKQLKIYILTNLNSVLIFL